MNGKTETILRLIRIRVNKSTMAKKATRHVILSLMALTLLAACTTVPQNGPEPSATYQPPSLSALEQAYKQNPNNVQTAINYAGALRDAAYLNRAAIVLAPYVHAAKPSEDALLEYSAVQLDLGNYITAEEYAQKAITKNDKNARAYHLLGIALDAQNQHESSEAAFRKAIEYWQGNPALVMNDLAQNLTTQEKVEEASETMEEAARLAPQNIDIERNLRILRALQQTNVARPPKPGAKPATH